MVASASSSNTKWPSGLCSAQRACAAEAIDSSSRSFLSSLGRAKRACTRTAVIASLFTSTSISPSRRRPRQPRRLGAGSDRTLDGGRELRRGPVAGEKEVPPGGRRSRPVRILLRKRGKRGAALLDDVPRRQRLWQFRKLYYVLPHLLRQRLAGRLDPLVGSTYRGGQPVRKSEQPLPRPVDEAGDGRQRFRWLVLEMHIDDGAEGLGRAQLRQKESGDRGRHCEDDRIAARKIDGVLAEIERADRFAGNCQPTQLMAESDHDTMTLQISDSGIDESGGETGKCHQRPAGAAATRKRLAQNRAGKSGRSLRGLGIQRGKKQWPPKPLIKDAVAGHEVGDALVLPRTQ